jgi:hypothetical protein
MCDDIHSCSALLLEFFAAVSINLRFQSLFKSSGLRYHLLGWSNTTLNCVQPLLLVCSYRLMEQLSTRWQTTGLWARLKQVKHVEMEPKGVAEFDAALQSYLLACHPDSRATHYAAAPSLTGGLFLAVCRGKLSEGIDFSDHSARGVLMIGIPFPAARDLQVVCLLFSAASRSHPALCPLCVASVSGTHPTCAPRSNLRLHMSSGHSQKEPQ